MALDRLTQITSSGISSTSTITVSAVAGVVTATTLSVTGSVTTGLDVSGIVTATTVQVGSATTIHTTGIDLGSGNINSHNINSTGIITATGGFVGDVTGDISGNVTGNLTGNVSSSGANTLGSLAVTNDATVGGALTVTGNLTVNGTTTTIDTAVTAVDSLAIDGDASVGGALTATGNITANAFYGDGSNLTGIDATQIQTGNTSVQTVDTGSDGHVKVTTEGTERLRINSSGLLGVGTSQPIGQTYIAGPNTSNFGVAADAALNIAATGGSLANRIVNLNFAVVPSATNAVAAIGMAYGSQSGFGNGHLIFGTRSVTTDTAPTERLRITSSGEVRVPDNGKFTCGTDDDTELYFDGTDTIIDHTSSSGTLRLRGDAIALQTTQATPETYISCNADSSVQLYHNNSEKLATTSGGINVTGSVTCDGLTCDGDATIQSTNGVVVIVDTDDQGLAAVQQIQGRDSANNLDWQIGQVRNSNNNVYIHNQNNANIVFSTNGTERAFISNGGYFLPFVDSTYDLGTSGNQWRNGYFGGTVTCDGLQCDAQAVFTRTADYQIVVKDSDNTGTAAETGIAFRDSADTVQSFIGHTSNTSENLEIHQTRNADITFSTNGSSRVKISSIGSLRPTSDNVYNLGESSYRWANVYTADLQMSNEGSQNDIDGTWGKYTIQEGENDLFLINRRTGKKYKFMLEEVK